MDKNEKKRRKLILNELREKQQHEFEQGLPISKDVFDNLFDVLDIHLEEHGCDHTSKLTLQFLRDNEIEDIEKVLDWLEENGGFCDCEILANVEELFRK
ncbi:MAG: DUF2695 domain-containing protein [Spirosomataceae bacterium]